MEPGQIVTGQALKKRYDAYFDRVLSDFLDRQDRAKKGERVKYLVVKDLPGRDEYLALRNQRFSVSAYGLIVDAYIIIQELADEMQEAYDNMPESLQQGDVGQRREEAANILSDLACNEPDQPTILEKITTVFLPHLDTSSRAKRASDAVDMLTSAALAIREYTEEAKPGKGDEADSLDDVADHIENDASELENVEFPGMYG